MTFVFWVSAYFQGRAVKVQESGVQLNGNPMVCYLLYKLKLKFPYADYQGALFSRNAQRWVLQ